MHNFNILAKFFISKDAKQLVDNFVSLSVLRFLNLVIPFLVLPYLIKTLGFEKYGVIVLSLSLTQYLQSITDYGFNISATRELARHKQSSKKASYIYSKVMLAKVVLLFFSIAVILPVIYIVPQFEENKTVFILMLLVLIGQTLFPEWFFRGVEKMRFITILNLMIKLFFTLSVFLFINEKEDYWLYPLLNGVGCCAVMIVAQWIVIRKFTVRLQFVKFSVVNKTLKEGFPVFLNQFAPNLYNNTTVVMVGLILGNNSAGIFGAVKQVINLLVVFNSVVTMVFFPYISRRIEKFDVFKTFYLPILVVIVLIMALTKDMWYLIFNIDIKSGDEFYYILLAGVFFTGLYSVYATCYLLVKKLDFVVLKLTLISSFVGFFLTYPLIKYFHLIGAASTISFTQALLGVLALSAFKKSKSE
ncbi:oligosaccharide flippase family protein [Halomonas marinisediminis]|uniref:Flippase n=1 Tax=Halomonas marinisediminis TaxID=2546095 RepID=A0ABY2D3X5_9GAMM|nr:oligosaccharide flippase family protein [Halomonas marinisediminis]TDA95758.1 flippase [Halomonas marinisediminis]